MKKTSDKWLAQKIREGDLNITVMDPDGWDRTNYQFSFFEEEITQEEFENRLGQSTVLMQPKKKSQVLHEQANAEDNDLKAMGIYNKVLREKRLERFETYLLDLEKQGYEIVENNHKYTIDTDTQEIKYGVIDYFPKANKVLIRKDNKWIKPGLNWIIKNLLPVTR